MNNQNRFYIPADGPPQGLYLDPKIYETMGEKNIYKMLEDFYQLLSESSINHMFPSDFKEASRKSAAFFVFIMGGPPLYQQQYGHPRMRQRHMPFAIDGQARQVWLDCFHTILKDAEEKYCFPSDCIPQFCHYLDRFSEWMVNTQSH